MGMMQDAFAALKAINQAGNIIKSDREVSNDLQSFLTEVSKEINAAAANPAADSSLKQAFNNVAGLLPAGREFAREGKLSIGTMIGLLKNKGKYEKSIETLGKAVEAGDPVANGFVDTLASSKALIRVAARTDGKVFHVQDGPDGTGIVNVLLSVPGIPGSFSLCQKDYAEFKAFMDAGKNPPPKGPGL